MNLRKIPLQAILLVVSLSIVSAVIQGTTFCTMGLFLLPVMEAFGSTNARVSEATTCFILAMTLTTPGLGWLMDRIGARLVMTFGAVVTAAGYWFGSRSAGVSDYVAAMGLAGLGVGASTYIPSIMLISSWFEQKRGLVVGAYLAANALGATIFPIWIAHRLTSTSWRSVQLLIAEIIAAVAVPTLLVCARKSPRLVSDLRDQGGATSGLEIGEGLRTRAFWFLGVTQCLAGLSSQGVFLYTVPFLYGEGYTRENSAILYGMGNFMTMGGFLLFGALADRFGTWRALASDS